MVRALRYQSAMTARDQLWATLDAFTALPATVERAKRVPCRCARLNFPHRHTAECDEPYGGPDSDTPWNGSDDDYS